MGLQLVILACISSILMTRLTTKAADRRWWRYVIECIFVVVMAFVIYDILGYGG